jgi:phenylacetaldehyde dehydrogenase
MSSIEAGGAWPLYIAGKGVPALAGRTFQVDNPATGEVIAEVAEGEAADIDLAVEAAAEAFTTWGETSGEARARVLSRAAAILARRLEEFVRTEVKQTGRPHREMAAQLARLPEWYDYFGALARTHEDTAPPFGKDYLNYTRRVPLGVIGQITPWNHPLLILTKKVAPALAAGNALVVKPSEIAPLTPLLLAEVFEEAGLPAGIYNVVPGYGSKAGRALAGHPGIRKLDITGGTETGRAVAALAGKNLARFTGELGGKAAVVAFEDMRASEIASAAMFAGFIATGQTCVQGARLIVHRSIHDAVVTGLVERTENLRLADPGLLSTQVGPLVSARQRETIERYVKIGLEEGATLAAGGRRPQGSRFARGYWYLPTIFVDVTPEMRVAREEIFGPVICVMPFDEEEEAIALANSTEYGLAASIWTRDLGRAHRVAQRMESGIVWINDHHRIHPASPWGGFKMSGLGRENGRVAYEEYTQIQSIVVRLSDEPFDWYADDSTAKRYS